MFSMHERVDTEDMNKWQIELIDWSSFTEFMFSSGRYFNLQISSLDSQMIEEFWTGMLF